MNEYEGFNVTDEVDIGSLDDVQEQRQLIEPCKSVKFKVKNASDKSNDDKTYRQVNLECQIVDGIDGEGKYKNKVVFHRFCYYADPEQYTKDWFKTKQHLVEFKKLYQGVTKRNGEKIAPIFSVNDATKVNDTLFQETIGQMFVADIAQKKGNDGYDDENILRNLRAIPSEDLV